jgi:hypothetical protein
MRGGTKEPKAVILARILLFNFLLSAGGNLPIVAHRAANVNLHAKDLKASFNRSFAAVVRLGIKSPISALELGYCACFLFVPK